MRSTKQVLLALLACALAISAHGQEAEQPAPASRATVVVYRTPGFVGVLVTHVVRVNGAKAARLKTKNYTTLSVPAGMQTICIFGDELCLEPFEAVAGATYFIRDTADAQYAGSGVSSNSIYLQRVDDSTGSQGISGLKAVEPNAEFR